MNEILRIRADELEWRLVDEEVVILDLHSQRFLSLNPSGARLWRVLADGGATREELAAELIAAYSIGVTQAAADVEELIASLTAESFLLSEPPSDDAPA